MCDIVEIVRSVLLFQPCFVKNRNIPSRVPKFTFLWWLVEGARNASWGGQRLLSQSRLVGSLWLIQAEAVIGSFVWNLFWVTLLLKNITFLLDFEGILFTQNRHLLEVLPTAVLILVFRFSFSFRVHTHYSSSMRRSKNKLKPFQTGLPPYCESIYLSFAFVCFRVNWR